MFRKTTVELHDGTIVVQPDYPLELTEALRYWRRTLVVDDDTYKRSVQGRYEELYKEFAAYDHGTNVLTRKLVTMPGFAKLVRDTLTECGWEVTLVDRRLPMPPPNIPAALEGLYDHQKPCAYTALMSGGGIIACPTGWGKCVGPETLQMYYDGTVKRADEVKVGDVLMGDDCTPRTVLERVDGQGPMYRITPKVGKAFTAADHHILCLVKSGTGKRDKYADGHIVELTVEDYIRRSKTFKHQYKLYRVSVDHAYKHVRIDPYFVGIWLGDGDWNQPTITATDPEIIEYIHTYATSIGMGVTRYAYSGTTPRWRIVRRGGKNNALLDSMREYGLVASKIKRIPHEFMANSREIRLQLLAGLLDSDGCLNEGTDFDFTSRNAALAGDVALLARTLGFRVHRSTYKARGFGRTVDCERLRITGDTHLIPTKIKRKQARTRKQCKNPLRTSFTVERIEDGPYVGVMLDGNGRYLLGDGTVTHNTHIMAALIKGHTAEALQLRGTPITIVATPDKDITLKDYEDLTELLPDREVGLIMSGRNKVSDDVQVITLNSLHRVDPLDVGVVIVDEVHASSSDARAEALSKFTLAARWGVSASPTGRFDGKDKVTEGLFGPIVYHRTYQQGVADGALVPIVVYWVKAPEPSIGLGSYLAYKTRDAQYRHGVRRSLNQNKMVAEILKRVPDSMQTLCIMQFIDQMDALMVHCDPGMRYVHAQTSKDKALDRARNLDAISAKERRQIYADMNSGEIRQILSTHVYKQGVNFPQLEVVINAGGGGSDIVATQIPGRQSRKIEGKDQSFLVDFWHPWDTVDKGGKDTPGPILKDDQSRRRAYKKLGFEQIWVDDVNDLPFLKGTQSKT